MWTGWVGNDGKMADRLLSMTAAERRVRLVALILKCLESAGLSWKFIQDVGHGLDAANFWASRDELTRKFRRQFALYFHHTEAPDSSSR